MSCYQPCSVNGLSEMFNFVHSFICVDSETLGFLSCGHDFCFGRVEVCVSDETPINPLSLSMFSSACGTRGTSPARCSIYPVTATRTTSCPSLSTTPRRPSLLVSSKTLSYSLSNSSTRVDVCYRCGAGHSGTRGRPYANNSLKTGYCTLTNLTGKLW